jgi:hypothetical protein
MLNGTWLTSSILTSPTQDFADAGVTPAEAALLTVVHYGLTADPADLPAIAARKCYSDGLASEEQCRTALAACQSKGWLQVIDEPALAAIAEQLRRGGFIGPVYGLPPLGGVDFTRAGAEQWQRLRDRRNPARPPFAFTDVVHSKTSRYFTTKTAALREIEEIKEWSGDVTVVGPTPIGPWRAQWWRRFPQGYRLDIEERQQWQGRCGGGGSCSLPPRGPGANPRRLPHVLDCHHVLLTEWLLLAAMDAGWYQSASGLPRLVAESADRHFGVTASEDECRSGLDACLRNGWLRAVDQQAIDDVEALLRDEPTAMPVAVETAGWGEIDFTPCGAALYRMIAAEWLGPNWEDELCVWKESYREEHRYCESEEGLRDVMEQYAAGRERVRASRVVAVGPWCVYWWEQFPAGYRLELQIGEP